jgi:hypothetical protein
MQSGGSDSMKNRGILQVSAARSNTSDPIGTGIEKLVDVSKKLELRIIRKNLEKPL